MLLLPLTFAAAQSGRRQDEKQKEKQANPLPPLRQGEGVVDQGPARPSANELPKIVPSRTNGDGDDDEVIRVEASLVPLLASVVDAGSGQALTDLTLEDFELTVDGAVRPISDLNRSELPVRLVLLFDNSSSLNPAREFQKKAAEKFFRRVIRPIDQAAIISISSEPVLEQTLTNDVKRLVGVISRFGKPKGATAMLDAIAQAADYIGPQQQQVRKVIVIISDGADTVSGIDFAATMRAVQISNCQVYAVQTGQSANANLRDLTAERRLQELTAQTGGAMFVPQTTSDLDDALAQISADLARQYVLSYYPAGEQRDGRFHRVSLRVPKRDAARVRTRQGYYARKM